jgi:hypothetical protein
MYKFVHGVFAVFVAVPAVYLVFYGLVYVPKPNTDEDARKPQAASRDEA